MSEVALGASSQDCRLEIAEAWLEAGLGSACKWVLSVFPWYPSLCAHKDPGDSGQYQWVWGLQAQSPGLSHELPSSAL